MPRFSDRFLSEVVVPALKSSAFQGAYSKAVSRIRSALHLLAAPGIALQRRDALEISKEIVEGAESGAQELLSEVVRRLEAAAFRVSHRAHVRAKVERLIAGVLLLFDKERLLAAAAEYETFANGPSEWASRGWIPDQHEPYCMSLFALRAVAETYGATGLHEVVENPDLSLRVKDSLRESTRESLDRIIPALMARFDEAVIRHPDPPIHSPGQGGRFRLVECPEGWGIAFGREGFVTVPSMKGLEHLQRLLALGCEAWKRGVDLEDLTPRPRAQEARSISSEAGEGVSDASDLSSLDAATASLMEAREKLRRAQADGDTEGVRRAQAHVDQVEDFIRQHRGVLGRKGRQSRKNALQAPRKAIREAIEYLAAHRSPVARTVAEHFAQALEFAGGRVYYNRPTRGWPSWQVS